MGILSLSLALLKTLQSCIEKVGNVGIRDFSAVSHVVYISTFGYQKFHRVSRASGREGGGVCRRFLNIIGVWPRLGCVFRVGKLGDSKIW